ncbi:hypothetical protein R1sor_008931 [Riccia sorocarpa]|uniref:Uncharacterized protein n=1 Tax=Riccia sorocarpa TaxID=122646 RepID=A0ABD3H4B6_9MARC
MQRAALVISNKYKVKDSGVRGDGSAAWARIESPVGEIVGDYNSVELPDDTQETANLLNDHFPVCIKLQWSATENHEEEKWQSYFKFRIQELQVEDVKEKVKEIWEAHPRNVTDAHVKWELAWNRVKKFLQRTRAENRLKQGDKKILAQELNALRSSIAHNNTLENRSRLAHLESTVKDMELKEAMAWRLRSKARWLKEGDAPSHYFFVMLKSNFKRENIESLTTAKREILTSKDEILAETHRFYQDLFSEDTDYDETERRNTLQEALGLLQKKINSDQSRRIEELQHMDEIERIVGMLPPEKSPGLDGVTSEVKGHLHGLEAGVGHKLFADDTGLLLQADAANWAKATEVINKFELMSGARLNVSKLLVVPIGFEEPPEWLRRAGCKLAVEGEIWSYLGCSIGINLTDEQILQWIVDRLTKRINHWSTYAVVGEYDGEKSFNGWDHQANDWKIILGQDLLDHTGLNRRWGTA